MWAWRSLGPACSLQAQDQPSYLGKKEKTLGLARKKIVQGCEEQEVRSLGIISESAYTISEPRRQDDGNCSN